jgi:hypothetical protein
MKRKVFVAEETPDCIENHENALPDHRVELEPADQCGEEKDVDNKRADTDQLVTRNVLEDCSGYGTDKPSVENKAHNGAENVHYREAPQVEIVSERPHQRGKNQPVERGVENAHREKSNLLRSDCFSLVAVPAFRLTLPRTVSSESLGESHKTGISSRERSAIVTAVSPSTQAASTIKE